MKVPVWLVIVLAVAAGYGLFKLRPHQIVEGPDRDSLEVVALKARTADLENYIAHQDSVINNRQHEIETIVKRVPIYVDRIRSVSADSQVAYLNFWTGQLQDSGYARRYFRLGSVDTDQTH